MSDGQDWPIECTIPKSTVSTRERDEHRQQQVKFCKAHYGRTVMASGMWTGDFIGVISDVGFTQVSFRVEKPAGDAVKPGDTVTFPYGVYLKMRELTDAEAQVAISEAVGDITIA